MSMITFRIPLFPALYRCFTSSSTGDARAVDIPPVEAHAIETSPEKRARTLKHLLKANHVNHSILFHNLEFHNHLPHILCSAYLLGASPQQLNLLYESESKELVPWEDSPAEIIDSDWRDFLGNRPYNRAYVDFFEDQLAYKYSYDWKALVEEYLLSGEQPLINCLIGGLGHPLIHIAYGFEFSSREVAVEGLAMAATMYTFYHKYLEDPSYTRPSTFSTTSPLEILHRVENDKRFDGLLQVPGAQNLELLFDKHEGLMMEYWNAWHIEDPVKQFRESQEAAVSLLMSTVKPGTHAYDFFNLHILTTSHAVRVILPNIPKWFHMNLVRQWWLYTLGVYIAQLRPKIDDSIIGRPDLGSKNWKYIEDKAINSEYATDPHYVKGLRAMKECAMTWGDVHEWYLTAAVRFADDFKGWTGFPPM